MAIHHFALPGEFRLSVNTSCDPLQAMVLSKAVSTPVADWKLNRIRYAVEDYAESAIRSTASPANLALAVPLPPHLAGK
jgi:hypothetical protein